MDLVGKLFSQALIYWAFIITFFILLFYIISSFSEAGRFYIRMILLSACYILASALSIFGSAYTYFQNGGGTFSLKMVKLCGSWLDLNVQVRGIEKLDEASGVEQKPLVLITNHQSSLDLYVMSFIQPKKTTAMMKNSLKYVPFFNIAAILSNAIFVNRYNKERSNLAVKEAVSTMLKKRLKIWVFPEGTRNRGEGMLPFKKGAFNIAIEAQIDVLPIVFSSYAPFYSKSGRYFREDGCVIAEVMDPIPTRGLVLKDTGDLCERVRSEMLKVHARISAEAKQMYEERMTKKSR